MEIVSGDLMLTSQQRYLFDTNGYLVIRGVLDSAELDTLNRLFDEQDLPEPGETIQSQQFGGFLMWGEAFRSLLDHKEIMPVLDDLLGSRIRLDRYYAIQMRPGTSGLPLHGGAQEAHDQSEYYGFRNGRMANGITTVSWALVDMLPGQGGFMCIPGSHKSNFEIPEEFDHTAECVVNVHLKAGDVVIFTGALAHGTYPWFGPHLRRSLLFKYAPGHLAWSPVYLNWSQDLLASLSPRQAALLEAPYCVQRHGDTTHKFAE